MRALALVCVAALTCLAALVPQAMAGKGRHARCAAQGQHRCHVKKKKSNKKRCTRRRARKGRASRGRRRSRCRRHGRRRHRRPVGADRRQGGRRPGATRPGSAPGSTAPAGPLGRYLSVSATEFRLTLSRPALAAGHVTLELRNRGEDPHNLVVSPDNGSHAVVAGFGATPSGGIDSRSLDLPAGRYYLWCSLAGHEAAGMHARLRVGG
jgi:hypothetical protein